VTSKTDDRGRLYIPKEVREEYGDRYRIVELPTHVALFPVAEDPIEAVRDAVGDALEGRDPRELRREARAKASRTVAADRDGGGDRDGTDSRDAA